MDKVNSARDEFARGKLELEADSRMMLLARNNIIKTLVGAGLLTGIGTAISHVLRDSATNTEDADLLQADVNALGATPQPKYRPKFKPKAASVKAAAPWGIDKDVYDKAPASVGNPKYEHWLQPTWAIPGLALALAAGYGGGKYLTDRLAYRLRKKPAEKRLEEAKREFEETVAGLSSGEALEKRLEEGYERHKSAAVLPGVLLAGMGGLGVLSALAAYDRFKAKKTVDIYRKQLEQYLTPETKLPQRVRPLSELAYEEGEEPVDGEYVPKAKRPPANDKSAPKAKRASDAAAGGAKPRTPFRFSDSIGAFSSAFGNRMLEQHESAGPEKRLEMERVIAGAQPTSRQAQSLADAAGRLFNNQHFREGAKDGLSKLIPSPGAARPQPPGMVKNEHFRELEEDKSAGVMDTITSYGNDIWNYAASTLGSAAASSLPNGGAEGVSGMMGEHVVKVLDGVVNNVISDKSKAYNAGKGIAGGTFKLGNTTNNTGNATNNAGGVEANHNQETFDPNNKSNNNALSGPPGAIARGLMSGVTKNIANSVSNPLTSAVLGVATGHGGGVLGGLGRMARDLFSGGHVNQASAESAFTQAGENFGKAWTEVSGGLGDRTGDLAGEFVEERVAPHLGPFGGMVSRAFSGSIPSPRNRGLLGGWLGLAGNVVFGNDKELKEQARNRKFDPVKKEPWMADGDRRKQRETESMAWGLGFG
jgi:hypothetical protein